MGSKPSRPKFVLQRRRNRRAHRNRKQHQQIVCSVEGSQDLHKSFQICAPVRLETLVRAQGDTGLLGELNLRNLGVQPVLAHLCRQVLTDLRY